MRRDRNRDVIAANVGPLASRVVVGKYNIQVGTLVLPTLPIVLTLILLVTAAGAFAWWNLVPAEMPISPLNIAVADIAVQDSSGKVRTSDDGRSLGEWIYRELQSTDLNLPAVVWHDSMGPIGKRTTIGVIEGATPDERIEAADALAERINANVVIHGVLSGSGGRGAFAPEFYVSDVLSQADELVGLHQLGTPISVRLPLDPYDLRTSEYLRAELGTRIDALTWITRAIVLDTNGRHADSLAVLEEAESSLPGWKPEQGREILHYFKGRQALYLSREDPSKLKEAEHEYMRALEINPDYARAHFGLGGVYHSLAHALDPPERLESQAIDLATDHYQRAIDGAAESPGSQIELKARLGLGSALSLLGEGYVHAADFDAAASVLDKAIENLERALPQVPEQDHRLLTEAYLALGAAYQLRAHAFLVLGDESASISLFERAEAAYSECITHADQDLYDDSSRAQKETSCVPYRSDVQRSLRELQGDE